MGTTETETPQAPGTSITESMGGGLSTPVAFDNVDQRRLQLLRSTVAQNCSDVEIGQFLELAARYDLDPFAKEVWCAKGGKDGAGKLLIMVGRDGLRKIAQRNGLHVDGDVVREKDQLSITRTPDGNRTVAHSYDQPSQRGGIVGAWAEVREGGPMGRPMGYFYAPLDEYRPANASGYSPWSKQVGVMILAAAERQAIRQATPLGGLLAEGEDESANAPATVTAGADGHPDIPHGLLVLLERVWAVDRRVFRRNEIAARLDGSDATFETVVHEVGVWLAEHEPEAVPDAVVVPDEPEADQAAPEIDALQSQREDLLMAIEDEPHDEVVAALHTDLEELDERIAALTTEG